jgi:threonine aldolase
MQVIDLRSDTVTRPTAAMREAGLHAEVGDDVFGDDPSVNALQDRLAGDLGFEAGLFLPSGTQSNLLALMAHCERGDEYLVGMDAHTYKYEGGGAAVLGSIQPQPIPHAADGTLPLDAVRAAIKPIGDPHFARTRLLALENTWHGRPLPQAYLAEAGALAREHGLAYHLDGARLYNAAVAGGVAAREIAKHFDSVSVCLSKGLGAPVGSVLVGRRELIDKARRWRKVLGGGMRQAGVLAAAALYALEHHVDRLAEDHDHARALAEGLSRLPEVQVDPAAVQTNMVFISLSPERAEGLRGFLRTRNILLPGGSHIRLVTHLDVTADDVAAVLQAVAEFLQSAAGRPQPVLQAG